MRVIPASPQLGAGRPAVGTALRAGTPGLGRGGIGGPGPPGCRFASSVRTDGGDGGVILEKNEKCLGFEMHREI